MFDKSKKFITRMLLLVMLLNVVTPTISQAAPTRYLSYIDYIKLIEDETNKKFTRPQPIITATTSTGKTVTASGSTRPENGDEYFTSSLYLPQPSIKVPIGTTINLNPNSSVKGSGSVINKWDWQIYHPITNLGYSEDFKVSESKTTSFVVDEPGIWRVYLNVADNYKVRLPNGTISELENWSDGGNWVNTVFIGSSKGCNRKN